MMLPFSDLSVSKKRTILLRKIKKAVRMFHLFDEDDKVLLGISGGKDSLTMLDLITDKSVWWAGKVNFFPVHIETGFSGEEGRLDRIRDFSKERGLDLAIIERKEIAKTAFGENRPQNPCFICSRIRRKALIETANEFGANKIALAHHLEDVLETFLLNLFWGREISTMMPDQPLFKGKFRIIRPLFLVPEKEIIRYSSMFVFPDLSAKCPEFNKTKRQYVKRLLEKLEEDSPGLKSGMFRSLFHLKPEYLLERYRKSYGKVPSSE